MKNIYGKRLDKTEERTKKIDDNNLIFTTLSTGETVDFCRKNGPLTFLKKIRDGKITIERAKELQEDLNNNIKKIRKKKTKKLKSKKNPANLNILFRSETIRFYDDYSSMILEAKKRQLKSKKNKKEQVLRY